MRFATPKFLLSSCITFITCIAIPNVAVAGWGNENWGSMLWDGPEQIPTVGAWALLLTGALIGASVVAQRTRRAAKVFFLAWAVTLPIVATAVNLPFVFVNGTTADANEVNANFNTLSNAVQHRTIQRSTGLGPDDSTDSGLIASRVLLVTKARADTALRIQYTDNLRVFGSIAACQWEILVDEASCPGGALVYNYYAYSNDNTFRNRSVVGYCEGLSAGPHTIQIHVDDGIGEVFDGSDCATGFFDDRWVLESEEVF
jgi:hypothetical protein